MFRLLEELYRQLCRRVDRGFGDVGGKVEIGGNRCRELHGRCFREPCHLSK